jgi:RimJ/RimL family protein N-acetyltransferase
MILLIPIAPTHAAALQPLLEDPAIAETTPFPSPYPPNGAEDWIADAVALREQGSKYAFAVCDPGGDPIGVTLLKEVDQVTAEAELGYWIGHPYWGGGRATAAAAATLNFAFDTLELRTVRAVCLEANPASLRVLAKLGFVEAGRFAQALPKWSEPRPSISWRLTKADWHPLRLGQQPGF